MRQWDLERLLRRQGESLQPLRVQDARIEEDARQPMGLRAVDAGQWQAGTLALEDVVADRLVGGGYGRWRIDVRIEVRAVDVVVAAAPQDVAQVAGHADRFGSAV